MRIHAALPGAARIVELVREWFDIDPAFLHDTLSAPEPLLEVGRDQQTPLHRRWYQIYDAHAGASLSAAYSQLLRHLREAVVQEPLLAQVRPTFRVHLPGNVATGGFHRDRDYNHSPHELNFLLAVTHLRDTASIWIQDEVDPEVLRCQRLVPGEILQFDGANLLHGSVPNFTGLTRVSLDFRILPRRHYDPDNGQCTVNQGHAFTIGDYWREIP
jgi:hypothetical protein